MLGENTKNTGETELIQLIRRGDRKVFTFLYQEYADMLYNLAFRYLKSTALAQDAVQYTFAYLWENHKDIEIKSSVKNYLYTMTKNYILNQIRHNNVVIAHHYEFAQRQMDFYDNVTEKIERREKLAMFDSALQQLPERNKRICLLKMQGGWTNEDIAKQLDLSTSSVKLIFKKSKEILREYMKEWVVN